MTQLTCFGIILYPEYAAPDQFKAGSTDPWMPTLLRQVYDDGRVVWQHSPFTVRIPCDSPEEAVASFWYFRGSSTALGRLSKALTGAEVMTIGPIRYFVLGNLLIPDQLPDWTQRVVLIEPILRLSDDSPRAIGLVGSQEVRSYGPLSEARALYLKECRQYIRDRQPLEALRALDRIRQECRAQACLEDAAGRPLGLQKPLMACRISE